MANTYKNIVITPYISNNTYDPKIQFSGANTSANTDITLYMYPDSNGTISYEGNVGQLFSITNDLSNNLFGVYDISGIPAMEIYANSTIIVGQYGANIILGNSTIAVGLQSNGSYGTAGQCLTSNGTSTYWSTPSAGVNTAATYTWTNTHTFNNPIYANTVNATSYTVGTSLIGNTTGIYHTGIINAASHTVGTSTIANATGVYTGVVNAASHTVGTTFIVNSTIITIANTVALSANGSNGTSGQLLTSNGSTVYWSTVTAGSVDTSASYTWTNTHSFTNTVTLKAVSANGSLGAAGYILASNGTSTYWVSPGASSVDQTAQYNWTNTHIFNSNTFVGNATFANTTLTSYSGFSNPQSLTSGVLQTNASLNTVLVGPYTISTGNSLVITTGSRVVVI